MRIVVHKGTAEIGGTCIELSNSDGIVLLDVGLPLAEDSRPIDPGNINPDAIIVSHPHQDHAGLLELVDPGVPVFIGELSRRLIDASHLFVGKELLRNKFIYFKAWQPFTAPGFKVTPYLVDHSAPDAYAFLVEDGEHRVFYSGDFRGHGRKSVLYQRMIQDPPSNIDVLLMEGTMIQRVNGQFPGESDVEEAIVDALKDWKSTVYYIICSSQNIDRLVSAYRACLRTGKTMVVDVYGAWVLEQLKVVSDHVPNMTWKQVRVYIPHGQYQIVKHNKEYFGAFLQEIFRPQNRVTVEELNACPGKYLYVGRLSSAPIIKSRLGTEQTTIIYSQWLGYLEDENRLNNRDEEMSSLREDPRVRFIYAHTAGHAVTADLQAFAAALKPEMLVPIHTEHRDEFKEHFGNVVELKDEQELLLEDRQPLEQSRFAMNRRSAADSEMKRKT